MNWALELNGNSVRNMLLHAENNPAKQGSVVLIEIVFLVIFPCLAAAFFSVENMLQ